MNPERGSAWWQRHALPWAHEQRWLSTTFVAALLVRLHWNLVVHPLGDYVYSDMNGYVQRANRLLDNGLAPHEYSSFFPYGTHWLVAGIKLVFGRDNFTAIGVVYALLGAIGVALAYAMARRASAFPRLVAPAVALVAIFYYPLISLGGYVLSEVPSTTCLMGAIVFSLRLVDHGRTRDAWGMGICAALGTAIRPQILLSVAFVGLFWIVWRVVGRASPPLARVRLVHLLQAGIPVAIVVALSAGLMHHNTGRWGLVSENGTFNLVYGRCHNEKIQSLPDGAGHGRVHFRPPGFLQLNNRERERRKEGKPIDIALDPVMGATLQYKGYIGDRKQHMQYVRECIAKTGWKKQLSYTYTNVVLLWRYNIPWPDSGRAQWRSTTRWWTDLHRMYFAVPGLLGLFTLVLGRRTIKQAFVAIHLLALVITAGIFFGEIRIRIPYDLVILFLAFEVYAFAGWLLWTKLLRQRVVSRWPSLGAGSRNGGSSAQNSSSS